ncbi:MAG: mitochondrial fission ELM1 family protein [Deltaproteobacteria bacterium]|jgi:mitochondrial fission protein ELM1|nr:mitochondrial fission ELM1 family protein [Deltaproteobacteria bacterium]
MKPLVIAAYFDGRPGHEKQTRGILNALTELTPIEVIAKEVAVDRLSYVKNWLTYIIPYRGLIHEKIPYADLIIGTGTHTHLSMLKHLKQQRKSTGRTGRVVTCMTPETILQKFFDLCCIPMHDQPAPAANVFVTQGPPNTVRHGDRHQNDKGLILLGGVDPKSHIWKSDRITADIRTIIDNNPEKLWTVSSSPRTPDESCAGMEALVKERRNVDFIRFEKTPSGWVEEQYALNQTVWVTSDSVSMVYEALTAGCSVGVLPVEWRRPDNKFNISLQYLTEKEMIVDFQAWLGGTPMPVNNGRKFNESHRCAVEILRRWWPERLQ